ncbi:sugar transferase [Anaeroarcus burkinensis]|uniref:sugar transferase n=1 Tax=Anaeroarcus burkinensis TaxID=82376 RepID=UPI0004828B52|nr:sugar transferase [Anaeroarcus burkinensis]
MKRVIDIFGSGLGLLFFAPLLVMAVLALVLWQKGPVLFRQQRPGHKGRPFIIYKLRTMAELFDDGGNLLADAERMTWIGAIVRKTSLDEVPQLWNVLKGEMSLVGPRPLLMEYLPLYSPEQMRRHDVLPGITGWAQVNGRNAISWAERFKLDVWYVDNQSLRLDLKIIWMTLKRVVFSEGVVQKGRVTVDKFQGNEGDDF